MSKAVLKHLETAKNYVENAPEEEKPTGVIIIFVSEDEHYDQISIGWTGLNTGNVIKNLHMASLEVFHRIKDSKDTAHDELEVELPKNGAELSS